MSWDILIMDLPRDAETVSEVPSDFKPEPLGDRDELISGVLSAAPMADFSDPSWGQIATRDFSIEVNIGNDEQVDSIMLHVRGGDGAIELIAAILDRLNRRALDIQTDEMFDKASAVTGLAAWRAYRDQVVNPPA